LKLQLALDDIGVDEALDLVATVRDHIDIVEVGTPLIIEEGMRPVRALKARFPDLAVLADTKIMDAGAYETRSALQAGADYATVLGVSDLATIEGCLASAREFGRRIVVDMIAVSDAADRIRRLEAIGVDALAVHVGVDQQALGRTPLDDLRLFRLVARSAEIFVAGGINARTAPDYARAGADVVIVGGGIRHARDPRAEAAAIRAAGDGK